MNLIYPAIFHHEADSYWVEFPDLPGCQTYGSTLEETLESAQEALAAYAETLLEEGQKLSPPSEIQKLEPGEGAFASLVYCDLGSYLRNAKAIKKTLTIPEWLNEMAIKADINFSQTLQNALIEKLGVNK